MFICEWCLPLDYLKKGEKYGLQFSMYEWGCSMKYMSSDSRWTFVEIIRDMLAIKIFKRKMNFHQPVFELGQNVCFEIVKVTISEK